jgi:lipid-binding SYLF domain-containing protein
MRNTILSLMAVMTVAWSAGCSTEPTNDSQRQALMTDARATLMSLEARDSGLRNVVDNSYAYIVFPDVGKGGFGIGGAWGRGIVVEQGKFVGYAAVGEGAIGALVGGQTYSELVVFKSREAFRKFQESRLSFGADANAVAIKAGAAASAQFRNGMVVFIHNQGGLMADLSINGQNISFVPAEQSDQDYWSHSRDRNSDYNNTSSYQSTDSNGNTSSYSTTTTR